MTDKERYKRTFSRLHASDHCLMEVETMKIRKIAPVRRMISVCAAAVLIAAMATVAYAADLVGIQRTVQVWIHGDQTNAVLELSGGSYTLTYDEEGEQKTVGGGGVSFDIFGNERPLTEEEIMEHLNSPQVEYRTDGTVWVYCRDQELEITDRFQNGVCYVSIKDGDQTLYLTVEASGTYSYSPHGYPAAA